MALLDELFGMPGPIGGGNDTESLFIKRALAQALAQAGGGQDLASQSTPARVAAAQAEPPVVNIPDRPMPGTAYGPPPAQDAYVPPPRQEPVRVADASGDMDMGQLGAMLQGFGDRNQGLIGRIGGAMQGGRDFNKTRETENLTVDALMKRGGLSKEEATMFARNPQILQQIVPTLFGSGKQWQIGEIFDPETGLPQKVMINQANPSQMVPVGGVKRDPVDAQITRDQMKSDNQELQKYRAAAGKAGEIVSSLDRMRELRKGISYEGMGPLSGLIAPVAGFFGYGEGQALDSEATRMQQHVRAAGEGSVSNYERELFASASPGLRMSDSGANIVIDGWEAQARRVQEKAKFMDEWRARNKTLSGAQAAWDRYANDNRILDTDGKGGFTINRDNIGNWSSYVEGAGGDRDEPASRSDAGAAPKLSPEDVATSLTNAKAAIARGAPRDVVLRRLKEAGIDTSGL